MTRRKIQFENSCDVGQLIGMDLIGSQMRLVAEQVRQSYIKQRVPNALRVMKAEPMVRADIARGLLSWQKLSGYYLYDLGGGIVSAVGTQKRV